MFSCLRRLGCLLIVALCAAAAWFTRDSWYPQVRARFGAAPGVSATAKWEPLTPEGAARGRVAFETLARPNGPVFVNLSAGDFASFVLDETLHRFSAAATLPEAMARDDRLYLRAQVSVADLGGPQTLGPLSLDGKQAFTIRGRIEVLTPGRAQFRLDQVALGDLPLPSAIIERLVARVAVRGRDSTIAADAVPVRVSRDLADVRIGKGRVTLYKNAP